MCIRDSTHTYTHTHTPLFLPLSVQEKYQGEGRFEKRFETRESFACLMTKRADRPPRGRTKMTGTLRQTCFLRRTVPIKREVFWEQRPLTGTCMKIFPPLDLITKISLIAPDVSSPHGSQSEWCQTQARLYEEWLLLRTVAIKLTARKSISEYSFKF